MGGKHLPHDDLVRRGLPKKGEVDQTQDQISQDIGKIKDITGKVFGKVRSTLYPKISENIPVVVNVRSSIKDKFNSELIKKIAKGFFVILFLILLLYITSMVMKTIVQKEVGDNGGVPTPSIAQFTPYKPSIYAEDELVLQLEEDVKVLERELSTSQLKENLLTPPVLDYNINFKE